MIAEFCKNNCNKQKLIGVCELSNPQKVSKYALQFAKLKN